MDAEQRRTVVAQLDAVLGEARQLLERFQASGLDATLEQDYQDLLQLLERAMAERHRHANALQADTLH